MAINKEAVQDLVDTLRSEKYTQISWKLRDYEKGRCCLGVACEVYKRRTGKGRWRRQVFTAGDSSGSVMPLGVFKYFGFESANPIFKDDTIQASASAVNDGLRFSFAEIGDLIETRYLKNA